MSAGVPPLQEQKRPSNTPSITSLTSSLETSWPRVASSSSPNLLATLSLPDEHEPQKHGLKRSRTLPRSPPAAQSTFSKKETSVELEAEKLGAFREWMLAISVVIFDVDYGPRIDALVPQIELADSERANIAFASFPDSHSSGPMQIHSFRVRSDTASRLTSREGETEGHGYLYGYSAFIQTPDRTNKRGYSQRSLVFLSQHPFPAFFSAAVAASTTLFMTDAAGMLETACHNISNWPPPTAGATLELGFLGSILHVEIPQHVDQQQLTTTTSFGERFNPAEHLLASHPPTDLPAVDVFAPVLSNLWSIWECLMLSEPIFIHGASPVLVSTAVWWLRDWLRPLPMAGDFRPYFTIHDPDHSRLINKNNASPGLILGTTNPFLYDEAKHWPHIISLGEGSASVRSKKSHFSSVPSSPNLSSYPNSRNASPNPKIRQTSKLGPALGFKTTHRRYISKDHAMLKELENALLPGTSRAERLRVSDLLRQHFAGRAAGILVPLNRYLTSLIPTPQSSPNIPTEIPQPPRISAVKTGAVKHLGVPEATPSRSGSPSRLRMKPFNLEDFLASLSKYGSPVPFKSTSRRKEFYERWCRSPAFGAWLMREESVVESVLREREGSTLK